MSESTQCQHPFQKLCYVPSSSKLLLAAAGSHIFSFTLRSGKLLAQWPSNAQEDDKSDEVENEGSQKVEEPVSKRRKVEPIMADENSSDSSVSVEIVAERAKGQRRKQKPVNSTVPKVSHIVATKDQRHVIAVTTEDKCIRVFELGKKGKLKLLSERQDECLV